VIQDEAAEAEAIADLANQLAMLPGNPERFHELKSEISHRLREMARRLRGDGGRRETLRAGPVNARREQVLEGERRGTTWRP